MLPTDSRDRCESQIRMNRVKSACAPLSLKRRAIGAAETRPVFSSSTGCVLFARGEGSRCSRPLEETSGHACMRIAMGPDVRLHKCGASYCRYQVLAGVSNHFWSRHFLSTNACPLAPCRPSSSCRARHTGERTCTKSLSICASLTRTLRKNL